MTQQPSDQKEVDYVTWCPKCKYIDIPDTDDPCNECLTYPTNLYSHKPVKFEEGKK